MQSVATSYYQSLVALHQQGVECTRNDNVVLCRVPWCDTFFKVELELVSEIVAGNTIYPVDVIAPIEIQERLTLDSLPALKNDWKSLTRSYLWEIISSIANVYGEHQAELASNIVSPQFQFEMESFLNQCEGVQFNVEFENENARVTCLIPLHHLEMPKFYALYGSSKERHAKLLVKFDPDRMNRQPEKTLIVLPHNLQKSLPSPLPLPKWTGEMCLSSFVPMAQNSLTEFVYGVRLRRAVVGGLSKLIGTPTEVDHIHYLKARFLKQYSMPNGTPPVCVILHADFAMDFPNKPPQLGLSSLSFVMQANGRPFSRALRVEWGAAQRSNVETVVLSIVDTFKSNIDGFLQKASSRSRGNVFWPLS